MTAFNPDARPAIERETIVSRTLTSEQETLDLPAGSVVVLHKTIGGTRYSRTAVYKTWSGNSWSLMDPSDRDDGSLEYPKDALWTIATLRDKMTPDLVWSEGDRVVPLTAIALAALPRQSVVLIVRVDGDNEYFDVYQGSGGAWRDMDPSDRFDGEESLSDSELIWLAEAGGGTLTRVWSPASI